MMPPPVEEKSNVPPGYTVMRGGQQHQGAPRVTSLGRPSAIGRGMGQFVPTSYQVQPFGAAQGMRLGEIPLANAHVVRQPSISTMLGQQTTTPVGTRPAPGTPNGNEDDIRDRDTRVRPQTRESLYRRRAWGRLKKRDAAELAEYLAEIEKRMEARGLPPGVVRQIRSRLEDFAAQNIPEDAEIELSDMEAASLDVAIMNLEQVEGDAGAPSFATAAGVIAALGLITVLAL